MKKSAKRTSLRKVVERPAEKRKVRHTHSDLPGKGLATSTISAEMTCLEENRERFARYAGQWLLLAKGKLLAHSKDYSRIANAIMHNGLKDGLVYYVPKPEESHFVL